MTRYDRLRLVAGALALAVCAIAGGALAAAALGGGGLATPTLATLPGTGLHAGLLLAGAALGLRIKGIQERTAMVLALLAAGLALLAGFALLAGWSFPPRIWWGAAQPVPGTRQALFATLALAAGGLAVATLGDLAKSVRWSISAGLASIAMAMAVAGMMGRIFATNAPISRIFSLEPHHGAALLLLGAGVLLARPKDGLQQMLLDTGTTGLLTRRLFWGAAPAPVLLSVVLLAAVQAGWLAPADAVILLCGCLILSGFAISVHSTAAAAKLLDEQRDATESRLMLTARLHEQTAQLQQIVSQRTLELRQANDNLRAVAESNALLASVAEHTTNGVILTDRTGRVAWVNPAFVRITGYALGEVQGRSPVEVLRGNGTDPATLEKLERAVEKSEACHLELLSRTKDSHPFWISMEVQPVRDRGGAVSSLIVTLVDITDERASQQRLLSLNDRLGLATRAAALGVWEWDALTKLSQWDARTLEIYGLRAEEYGGRIEDWSARLHPEDRERMVAAITALNVAGNEFDHEYRIIRANDGAVRFVQSRAIVQRSATGQLLRITGTDRDITAERDAAHRMALLNERLRLALRSSSYGVWEYDVQTHRILWDDRMHELNGISRENFAGTREAWRQRIHPNDCELVMNHVDRVVAGEISSYDIEYRIILPNGTARDVEAHGYLQRDPHGRPLRLVGLSRDVTERRQLQDRVRKSEELAKEVAGIARVGGWEYEFGTEQVTWTEGVSIIHEVDSSFHPSLANTVTFYPENPMQTWPGILDTHGTGALEFDQEVRLITALGNERWIRVLGRAENASDGQRLRVHGTMQDVTARHESEVSRRALEVQLFQAQKMETLGTLAGGIAHDFNNLLTGIIGYHELAADSLPSDHPARSCLHEARQASLRARELIEQILTFGRQTTGSGHVVLDLVALIEEARRFLRSTLPATINIELRVAPHLPPLLGDATQINQVLLNLGSNAAHAMRAHGGTLTIAAEPAEITSELAFFLGGSPAGAYVRLTVADTGHGMDESTRSRIFDPFFTTKNTREGTGLGLAVVHGIVRAHRGVIDVESKPGEGARFHIYLPAATEEQEVIEGKTEETPGGAGEMVVIVDDEEIVGTCTKLVLGGKGYATAVYRSAEECLTAFDGGRGDCALLITDQTMPGMSGTDLIANLRKRLPQLPAVLMSGYFSKISPTELGGLGQVELLAKPFTSEELAASVHRALHPVQAVP